MMRMIELRLFIKVLIQPILSDQKVIVDPEKVNIQIHYVSPGLSKTMRLGKDQYMFAIYIPKNKIYFVKDDDRY